MKKSVDEKFIISIFNKYFKAKMIFRKQLITNNIQEKTIEYGDNNYQLTDYYHHLQIVETILALLPQAEYTCLIKDFFNQVANINTNCFWWKKYYSQNDYQELKTKAISHFLYLFLL